jgi:histidinol phosphatase-like enzyme
MLWFFKYFRQKIQQKILAFFTQNKAKLCKILIITLVFEKNANFYAENCRKSQKIVIITLTPSVGALFWMNASFFQTHFYFSFIIQLKGC